MSESLINLIVDWLKNPKVVNHFAGRMAELVLSDDSLDESEQGVVSDVIDRLTFKP